MNQVEKNTIRELVKKIDKVLDMTHGQVKPVYQSKDLVEMFGITYQTLSKWRKKGLIKCSQVERKYFYSYNDVKDFLESTRFEK